MDWQEMSNREYALKQTEFSGCNIKLKSRIEATPAGSSCSSTVDFSSIVSSAIEILPPPEDVGDSSSVKFSVVAVEIEEEDGSKN
eukprot:TRINITY_DN9323_c0_g1_i1.p2 TRINITY_DN9323_c0_g1~~TRINITY_DN9323_c0_g1_i1.p2  ORF type:complete len:85 (-),score=17.06 TRINITY_DN9323_c0_g1_i1:63-317(-)